MNRRFVILMLMMLIFTQMVSPGWSAPAQPVVEINGKELKLDVAPVIQQGTTLVSLRGVLEELGLRVEYFPATRTVKAWQEGMDISLTIGVAAAKVNGREVPLPLAPQIIAGRTFVPVRFIAETIGAKVDWVSTTKTVRISLNAQRGLSGQPGGVAAGNDGRASGGREIPLAWWGFVQQPGSETGWSFIQEPRRTGGEWHLPGFLNYMDFAVVTGADQVLSQPPLQTIAPIYPPRVDYNRYVVLWAYLGEANTGGYGITVEGVKVVGDQAVVRVRMSSPAPGDMVTMAFTYPTDMVRLDRQDLAGVTRFVFVNQAGQVLKEIGF